MKLVDIIKLLRFPFSIFLMPVFLFAVSQATNIYWTNTLWLFVILHVLVYPSSNAYNSYMDKDETSIGGLKHPPKAGKPLFWVSLLFDALAILLATLFINVFTACLILSYIIASRLYSYRGIRLKKYPIGGWLIVAIFQGGFTYYLTLNAISNDTPSILAMLATTMLIGGVYPLTQIYQHQADANDGVKTMSMLLGYKGTFMFTICMFAMANLLLYIYFNQLHQLVYFVLMSGILLPTVLYFLWWFFMVIKSTANATFERAMRMNMLASLSLNVCFGLFIFLNHISWAP
jgi:1,4-dihydroxy-2-naphthoate polyprenyltransferase